MTRVEVSEVHLVVEINDGQILSIPRRWYPRLDHGTPSEDANWRPLGDGYAATWPELDEFIGLEGLLYGKRSLEGPKSLTRWLANRPATTPATP